MPEHLYHICNNHFTHQRNAASSLILHKRETRSFIIGQEKQHTHLHGNENLGRKKQNNYWKLKFCQDTGNILFSCKASSHL